MSTALAEKNALAIADALLAIGTMAETIEEGVGIEIIEAGEMTPVRGLEGAGTVLLTRGLKLDETTVGIDSLTETLMPNHKRYVTLIRPSRL